jgi:hypothetical protein
LVSYGVRVGIRTNKPEILKRLQQLLPPGWKPADSPVVERLYSLLISNGAARPGLRRFHLLYGDAEVVGRESNLDSIFEVFESNLQLYVAEHARRRTFIHAGVVGWRGCGVVIPGRSFSGKTTLVRELVRAGATYYSDEYAVLDGRGLVHPFPKPLGIRHEGSTKQTKQRAEAFGGRTGVAPLPVGLILSSRFKRGATWRPRRVSAGGGVLALLANAVPARRDPGRTLAILRRVVLGAQVLRGTRGDAAEVAGTLLDRVRIPNSRIVPPRSRLHWGDELQRGVHHAQYSADVP